MERVSYETLHLSFGVLNFFQVLRRETLLFWGYTYNFFRLFAIYFERQARFWEKGSVLKFTSFVFFSDFDQDTTFVFVIRLIKETFYLLSGQKAIFCRRQVRFWEKAVLTVLFKLLHLFTFSFSDFAKSWSGTSTPCKARRLPPGLTPTRA